MSENNLKSKSSVLGIFSKKNDSLTGELTNSKYNMAKNSVLGFAPEIIYEVPLEDIDLSDKRFQMRLPGHDISGIKSSIENGGQETPAVLLKRKDFNKLILISGFSRAQACDELNIKLKALIKTEVNDADCVLIGLTENEARKDLADWERIQGTVMAIKEGKTASEVAKAIGKDHSTVSLYQKVFNAKEPIRTALKKDLINFTKAHILSVNQDRLTDTQIEEVILKTKDMTVSNFKNVVSEILNGKRPLNEAVQKEKDKPKRTIKSKRNRFAVNIKFKQTGEVFRFSAKILIGKENKDEVRTKFEEILKEIKDV